MIPGADKSFDVAGFVLDFIEDDSVSLLGPGEPKSGTLREATGDCISTESFFFNHDDTSRIRSDPECEVSKSAPTNQFSSLFWTLACVSLYLRWSLLTEIIWSSWSRSRISASSVRVVNRLFAVCCSPIAWYGVAYSCLGEPESTSRKLGLSAYFSSGFWVGSTENLRFQHINIPIAKQMIKRVGNTIIMTIKSFAKPVVSWALMGVMSLGAITT